MTYHKKNRLYIAIEPPEDVKLEIKKIQVFINENTDNILSTKSYTPELLHITIQFIGDIEEELIPHYENILKNITKQTKPFDLTQSMNNAVFTFYAKHVAAFKLLDTHNQDLQNIVNSLRQEFLNYFINDQEAKLSFDARHELFDAHLSFGRTKQPHASFFETTIIKSPECKSFIVNRLVLFKRFLHDDNRVEKKYFPLLGLL